MTLSLPIAPEANALLQSSPLALLLGMLLDQQVPMEKAFAGPQVIKERLGRFDAHAIAEADPDEFAAMCSKPPAIHRFPGSMAKRVQELCRTLVERYDGRAEDIWTDGDPDGRTVLKRLRSLPGFGEQKARIFVALLGKQYGVQPAGWREAAGPYGEEGSRRSVADVTDEQSLQEVRAFKKQMKASAKSTV
ncbi:MAG TPA: HhH-GPD-type base excision DNA repair protein [Pseudonocardiaceae bacterium]|nr:HhH-GPD-type base excision DNA repair protein [Pseudonocardiaceae bacterium]